MTARHTTTVEFYIGPKWGSEVVWLLMPMLKSMPLPMAQRIVTVLTHPSHIVRRRDGGAAERCPGWQIKPGGTLVIGEESCR